MNELKIDLDNISFNTFCINFKKTYFQLKFVKINISKSSVYKTKKGYHIFLYLLKNNLNNRLLLECFFLSDVKKQLYAFIEQKDILFDVKNNYSVKFLKRNTNKLNKIIDEINRNYYKLTILKNYNDKKSGKNERNKLFS